MATIVIKHDASVSVELEVSLVIPKRCSECGQPHWTPEHLRTIAPGETAVLSLKEGEGWLELDLGGGRVAFARAG